MEEYDVFHGFGQLYHGFVGPFILFKGRLTIGEGGCVFFCQRRVFF